MCGSARRTITRPVPPVPRRKSMALMPRPPLGATERATGEPAAPLEAAAAVAGDVDAVPSNTMMSLPETRVRYGSKRSRFRTRRVRPAASAASTESTPPERISMRRDGSASAVFARSSEIRAGLSIVNATGSAGGPGDAVSAAAVAREEGLHVDRTRACWHPGRWPRCWRSRRRRKLRATAGSEAVN